MTARVRVGLIALALLAVFAYLRDPPWLVHVTSGMGEWETDERGEPYRWTQGRASFFVPADAGRVTLRLRALNDTPTDWPINVTVSVDDRPAQLVPLPDEEWHTVSVDLPPPGSRAVRRIGIHLDRTRKQQRGVQLRPLLMHPR